MKPSAQRRAPPARPAQDPAPFKPVALPALVAAMRGVAQGAQPRKPAPRKPAPRDLPAILREDALIG